MFLIKWSSLCAPQTIVTPLTAQIKSFADTTLPALQALIGENTSSFLSESIFLFNTGGNDFIDHCFGDTPCVLPEFVETLIDKYTQVIEVEKPLLLPSLGSFFTNMNRTFYLLPAYMQFSYIYIFS